MKVSVATSSGCDGATVGDAIDELRDFAAGDFGNAAVSPLRQRLLFQDALDLIVRAIVTLVAFQPISSHVAEEIGGVADVGDSGSGSGLVALREILACLSPRFVGIL
jgi:hypothetical protein